MAAPSKSDINKRFYLVFKKLKGDDVISSNGDAAEKMGISGSMLNEILGGRANLGTDHLQIFCKCYNVNPLYLLYEILPIRITDETVREFQNNSAHLFLPKNDHLNDHPNDHLKGKNIHTKQFHQSIAAESSVDYKKGGPLQLLVSKTDENGVALVEGISLGELAKAMGIEDIKELLDKLLAQKDGKKPGK